MEFYKIWVDDIRYPPNTDWIWVKSVNQAKTLIEILENTNSEMIISLDHDAGVYAVDGGDYINILNYLEARANKGYKVKCTFRIHSFNPVGVVNMRAIIRHNNWKEIL
jgi:hypothetical protein